MINLLPLEEKRNISKEKTQKIIVVLFVILFFSLIAFSLMLFFIKIYTSNQVNYYKIILGEKEGQFQESEIQKIEKDIARLNNFVFILSDFYGQEDKNKMTEIIEELSKNVPATVNLNNLKLEILEEEEKKINIIISGHSPDVSYVVDFKKNLEAEVIFDEVFFPSSNFIHTKDVDFSAILNILYED